MPYHFIAAFDGDLQPESTLTVQLLQGKSHRVLVVYNKITVNANSLIVVLIFSKSRLFLFRC
jgi:hypothetical protein